MPNPPSGGPAHQAAETFLYWRNQILSRQSPRTLESEMSFKNQIVLFQPDGSDVRVEYDPLNPAARERTNHLQMSSNPKEYEHIVSRREMERQMLLYFHTMVVTYGVDPKAAHEALLEVDDWQQMFERNGQK